MNVFEHYTERDIEEIAFGIGKVARHFADSPIVILFIVERLYVHHHTVAALIGPRLAHWSRTVSGLEPQAEHVFGYEVRLGNDQRCVAVDSVGRGDAGTGDDRRVSASDEAIGRHHPVGFAGPSQ